MKALLAAQGKLAVKPRILVAPGLDTQPVAAAFATIAQSLRAFVYVTAHGCKTKEEAAAYRKQFGQREIMVIWPDWLGWDDVTNSTVAIPGACDRCGPAREDRQRHRWHKTLSNVVVNGVTASARTCRGICKTGDGRRLSEREPGYDAREPERLPFLGSRTCDADGKFFFENYTRSAQVIADTIAEAQMGVVDGRSIRRSRATSSKTSTRGSAAKSRSAN
ncbi:phage tail sheath subtilisin-like domain-containing protein [Burkholderia gladioli]|nr:phage tail sheath subtilisin-like domain-containing protein [Burkholderia gladioli]